MFALAAAALAIAAVAIVPGLPRNFLLSPQSRTAPSSFEWASAAGTGTDVMNRVMTKATEELRNIRGVSAVGGHVGRAITSDTSSDVNSSEIWVTMEDNADYSRVRSEVSEIVEGYPGLTPTVTTYPEQQLAAATVADDRQFTVRVYGVDLAILREKAEEVRQILSRTNGVVDPRVDVTVEQPVAEIEVDLAAAQKEGIKPGDVRRAAATVLQGIEVGYMFEQQKVFQVIVKGTQATRNSLTSVTDMVVDKPDGGHVRLGDVAKVTLRPNQTVIQHDNTSRRLDVVANIQGRDLSAVKAEVETAIRSLQFPVEYHAEIPKQYGEQQAAGALFWWLAAAAAAGVLVLLLTVLGSWRLAGLSFVLLPVALAGGVIAAELAGGIGSVYVLVALAAVLAFAIRDVVLLMGTYQSLQSK